jgi:hypothetical protein
MPLSKWDLDALLKVKKPDCERRGWKFDGKIDMWGFRFPPEFMTTVLLTNDQELLRLRLVKVTRPHVWHMEVRMLAVYGASRWPDV